MITLMLNQKELNLIKRSVYGASIQNVFGDKRELLSVLQYILDEEGNQSFKSTK